MSRTPQEIAGDLRAYAVSVRLLLPYLQGTHKGAMTEVRDGLLRCADELLAETFATAPVAGERAP